MNNMNMGMILKYATEGIAVGAVSMILSSRRGATSKPNYQEALIISLVAMSVFLILDMFAPKIGSSSRLGVGVTVGSNLVDGIAMKKAVLAGGASEGFSGIGPSHAEGIVPGQVTEGPGLPSAFDSSSAMSSMSPF